MVTKLLFFKDEHLSLKFILGILLIKCVGCFAYYWVYFCYYPAGFNGDSVSTLHDARIMYDALPEHPGDFIKMVLGLHSDLDTDPLYQPYFYHIEKWGRADISSSFFLNDNRTPIRINAIIMLFSFGNYAVHALAMLIFSFVGQFAFYKAFKNYFQGREKLLGLIIFLSPSVLFWTSGVLKEPIAICLLGLFIYSFIKLFVEQQFRLKYILLCSISALVFLVLKPYILFLVFIPLLLFALAQRFTLKRLSLFYLVGLLVIYGGVVGILKYAFQKDVLKTIVVRQNDFINLSRGGTFFLKDGKYVRFENSDTTHYESIDEKNKLFKLNRHAAFMYWRDNNLRDTIYETNNKDTSTFKFISKVTASGSAINMERLEYNAGSFAKLIPQSFLNVLLRPFFFDSRSVLEVMASLENLLFFLFFVFCFWFRKKTAIDVNLLLLCITLVICAFILVGLTTTVVGAIVRYKTPFIPFLLMIPLMYVDPERIKKVPVINLLVK
ncbi:MAG: hypothetical protein V4580_19610 [Bacteroidota bacterium]